ncbi:hypothetical protein [Flexibacterium corallicola]|uniref:hypothetical protein n=1 Tax=Flexibacterium corallicola TaxID=3037259 RepID=UPI00286F1841|nr:hypothetical protein [Pseudovibrio sp. M1P-2-3]
MYFIDEKPELAIRAFHAVGITVIVVAVLGFFLGIVAALGAPAYMFGTLALYVAFAAGGGIVTGMIFVALAQIITYLRKNVQLLEDIKQSSRY